MIANIGYYLGLVLTKPTERASHIQAMSSLLLSQNFDCFAELIPLGIACKVPEVRSAALEAAETAFHTSAGNEAVLHDRIAKEPYDLEWGGALELLCVLAPQTDEAAETMCKVLGMNRKRGHNAVVEMVTKALMKYSNDQLHSHLLALLQSGNTLSVVRALELCFKREQALDSMIANEIRSILAKNAHSEVYERARLAAVKHGLVN